MPTRSGEYGWSAPNYAGRAIQELRGKVTVHETESDFQEWVDEKLAEQNRSQLTMATDSQGR